MSRSSRAEAGSTASDGLCRSRQRCFGVTGGRLGANEALPVDAAGCLGLRREPVRAAILPPKGAISRSEGLKAGVPLGNAAELSIFEYGCKPSGSLCNFARLALVESCVSRPARGKPPAEERCSDTSDGDVCELNGVAGRRWVTERGT